MAEGEDEFFFGLATAPAHVEDRLNDSWLQFAEENPCDKSQPDQGMETADALIGSAAGDGGSQPASVSNKDVNKVDMKKRKPLKVAMEAMIRGFEKHAEDELPTTNEECHHNVAAWHNVPHP